MTVETLSGKKVAIPGKLTTAALLLRMECPEVEPVEVMFDDIPHAVLSGEVDAGVIIHESQLTYVARKACTRCSTSASCGRSATTSRCRSASTSCAATWAPNS